MSLNVATKIYFEIFEEFLKDKIISDEQFLKREKITNNKELFSALKSAGINEILLIDKLSQKFKIKKISTDEIDKNSKFIITEKGVIVDKVYYLLNPFNNMVSKIKDNNKKYNNYFFEDIGIISSYNYKIYKKIIEKRSLESKNEDKNLITLNTNEIVINAIENDCNQIIINKDVDIIQFKKNNFTFNSKFSSEIDTIELNKVLKYLGNNYFIKTEVINEKFKIIHINNYEDVANFNNEEFKYKKAIFNHLKESSGLFILSEKYPTEYYHFFLEYMFMENKDKIILSIEDIKTKVRGVNQINIKNLEKDSLKRLITKSDIVFVENLDSNEKAKIIFEALNMGKFVFVSMVSQDSIFSLNNIIHNFDNIISPNIISENLIAIYHATMMPKICNSCSEKVVLKNAEFKNDPKFNLLFTTNDLNKTYIKNVNQSGCSKCTNGYSDKVIVSELLEYDKDLANEIENGFNIRIVRNMKNSKRWETVFNNSINQLLKGKISIHDIKSKI